MGTETACYVIWANWAFGIGLSVSHYPINNLVFDIAHDKITRNNILTIRGPGRASK